MATQTITTVLRSSDLSGAELPKDAPRVKVTLTVDGNVQRVELDVTSDELETLKVALKPYFDAAPVSVGTASVSGSTEANQAMRRWAIATSEKADGKYLYKGEILDAPAPRGRLSQQWKDAYNTMLELSRATEDVTDTVTEEVKGKGKGK